MNYLNSIVSVMIHLELKFRGSGNICNVSLKKSQTEWAFYFAFFIQSHIWLDSLMIIDED